MSLRGHQSTSQHTETTQRTIITTTHHQQSHSQEQMSGNNHNPNVKQRSMLEPGVSASNTTRRSSFGSVGSHSNNHGKLTSQDNNHSQDSNITQLDSPNTNHTNNYHNGHQNNTSQDVLRNRNGDGNILSHHRYDLDGFDDGYNYIEMDAHNNHNNNTNIRNNNQQGGISAANNLHNVEQYKPSSSKQNDHKSINYSTNNNTSTGYNGESSNYRNSHLINNNAGSDKNNQTNNNNNPNKIHNPTVDQSNQQITRQSNNFNPQNRQNNDNNTRTSTMVQYSNSNTNNTNHKNNHINNNNNNNNDQDHINTSKNYPITPSKMTSNNVIIYDENNDSARLLDSSPTTPTSPITITNARNIKANNVVTTMLPSQGNIPNNNNTNNNNNNNNNNNHNLIEYATLPYQTLDQLLFQAQDAEYKLRMARDKVNQYKLLSQNQNDKISQQNQIITKYEDLITDLTQTNKTLAQTHSQHDIIQKYELLISQLTNMNKTLNQQLQTNEKNTKQLLTQSLELPSSVSSLSEPLSPASMRLLQQSRQRHHDINNNTNTNHDGYNSADTNTNTQSPSHPRHHADLDMIDDDDDDNITNNNYNHDDDHFGNNKSHNDHNTSTFSPPPLNTITMLSQQSLDEITDTLKGAILSELTSLFTHHLRPSSILNGNKDAFDQRHDEDCDIESSDNTNNNRNDNININNLHEFLNVNFDQIYTKISQTQSIQDDLYQNQLDSSNVLNDLLQRLNNRENDETNNFQNNNDINNDDEKNQNDDDQKDGDNLVNQLQTQLDSVNLQIQTLNTQLNTHRDQSLQQKDAIIALTAQIQQFKDEKIQALEQQNQFGVEKMQLLAQFNTEKDELLQQIQRLKDDKIITLSSTTALTTQLHDFDIKLTELKTKIRIIEDENVKLKDQNVKTNQENGQIRLDNQQLQINLDKLHQAYNSLSSQNDTSTQIIQQLQQLHELINDNHKQYNSSEHNNPTNNNIEAMNSIITTLNAINTNQSKHTTQLDNVYNNTNSISTYIDSIKQDMTQMDQNMSIINANVNDITTTIQEINPLMVQSDDKYNQVFSTIRTTLVTMMEAVEDVDTRVENVDNRITLLENIPINNFTQIIGAGGTSNNDDHMRNDDNNNNSDIDTDDHIDSHNHLGKQQHSQQHSQQPQLQDYIHGSFTSTNTLTTVYQTDPNHEHNVSSSYIGDTHNDTDQLSLQPSPILQTPTKSRPVQLPMGQSSSSSSLHHDSYQQSFNLPPPSSLQFNPQMMALPFNPQMMTLPSLPSLPTLNIANLKANNNFGFNPDEKNINKSNQKNNNKLTQQDSLPLELFELLQSQQQFLLEKFQHQIITELMTLFTPLVHEIGDAQANNHKIKTDIVSINTIVSNLPSAIELSIDTLQAQLDEHVTMECNRVIQHRNDNLISIGNNNKNHNNEQILPSASSPATVTTTPTSTPETSLIVLNKLDIISNAVSSQSQQLQTLLQSTQNQLEQYIDHSLEDLPSILQGIIDVIRQYDPDNKNFQHGGDNHGGDNNDHEVDNNNTHSSSSQPNYQLVTTQLKKLMSQMDTIETTLIHHIPELFQNNIINTNAQFTTLSSHYQSINNQYTTVNEQITELVAWLMQLPMVKNNMIGEGFEQSEENNQNDDTLSSEHTTLLLSDKSNMNNNNSHVLQGLIALHTKVDNLCRLTLGLEFSSNSDVDGIDWQKRVENDGINPNNEPPHKSKTQSLSFVTPFSASQTTALVLPVPGVNNHNSSLDDIDHDNSIDHDDSGKNNETTNNGIITASFYGVYLDNSEVIYDLLDSMVKQQQQLQEHITNIVQNNDKNYDHIVQIAETNDKNFAHVVELIVSNPLLKPIVEKIEKDNQNTNSIVEILQIVVSLLTEMKTTITESTSYPIDMNENIVQLFSLMSFLKEHFELHEKAKTLLSHQGISNDIPHIDQSSSSHIFLQPQQQLSPQSPQEILISPNTTTFNTIITLLENINTTVSSLGAKFTENDQNHKQDHQKQHDNRNHYHDTFNLPLNSHLNIDLDDDNNNNDLCNTPRGITRKTPRFTTSVDDTGIDTHMSNQATPHRHTKQSQFNNSGSHIDNFHYDNLVFGLDDDDDDNHNNNNNVANIKNDDDNVDEKLQQAKNQTTITPKNNNNNTLAPLDQDYIANHYISTDIGVDGQQINNNTNNNNRHYSSSSFAGDTIKQIHAIIVDLAGISSTTSQTIQYASKNTTKVLQSVQEISNNITSIIHTNLVELNTDFKNELLASIFEQFSSFDHKHGGIIVDTLTNFDTKLIHNVDNLNTKIITNIDTLSTKLITNIETSIETTVQEHITNHFNQFSTQLTKKLEELIIQRFDLLSQTLLSQLQLSLAQSLSQSLSGQLQQSLSQSLNRSLGTSLITNVSKSLLTQQVELYNTYLGSYGDQIDRLDHNMSTLIKSVAMNNSFSLENNHDTSFSTNQHDNDVDDYKNYNKTNLYLENHNHNMKNLNNYERVKDFDYAEDSPTVTSSSGLPLPTHLNPIRPSDYILPFKNNRANIATLDNRPISTIQTQESEPVTDLTRPTSPPPPPHISSQTSNNYDNTHGQFHHTDETDISLENSVPDKIIEQDLNNDNNNNNQNDSPNDDGDDDDDDDDVFNSGFAENHDHNFNANSSNDVDGYDNSSIPSYGNVTTHELFKETDTTSTVVNQAPNDEKITPTQQFNPNSPSIASSLPLSSLLRPSIQSHPQISPKIQPSSPLTTSSPPTTTTSTNPTQSRKTSTHNLLQPLQPLPKLKPLPPLPKLQQPIQTLKQSPQGQNADRINTSPPQYTSATAPHPPATITTLETLPLTSTQHNSITNTNDPYPIQHNYRPLIKRNHRRPRSHFEHFDLGNNTQLKHSIHTNTNTHDNIPNTITESIKSLPSLPSPNLSPHLLPALPSPYIEVVTPIKPKQPQLGAQSQPGANGDFGAGQHPINNSSEDLEHQLISLNISPIKPPPQESQQVNNMLTNTNNNQFESPQGSNQIRSAQTNNNNNNQRPIVMMSPNHPNNVRNQLYKPQPIATASAAKKTTAGGVKLPILNTNNINNNVDSGSFDVKSFFGFDDSDDDGDE